MHGKRSGFAVLKHGVLPSPRSPTCPRGPGRVVLHRSCCCGPREIILANEILDSADVMRQLFGEREGLTYQTRNALPQSIVEALDVVGFACFLCNDFVPIRRDHSRVGVILWSIRESCPRIWTV